jgi:hypothetical protein
VLGLVAALCRIVVGAAGDYRKLRFGIAEAAEQKIGLQRPLLWVSDTGVVGQPDSVSSCRCSVLVNPRP